MASPSARFYYKGDRLKPLRAFCQVARLGSVSRAAEALFLSQPAVTLQLQALAQAWILNQRAVERTNRKEGNRHISGLQRAQQMCANNSVACAGMRCDQ